MSAEMTVRTQIGSIKTFSCLQKVHNMTANDTHWCEITTAPQPTYFLSMGYMRVHYGLYRPPAGVLRWHQHANACSLLGQSFEHPQHSSAGKSDLCAQVRVRSMWNTDSHICSAGICGQQKLSPIICLQGLPGKVWQGLNGYSYLYHCWH